MVVGQTLALAAGLCGALAATSAKLAMTAQSAEDTCHLILTENSVNLCSVVLIYIRLACFGMIFFFNALMWTLFVRSLQHCRTSLEATVTNTGSNIGFTAIIGRLLFGETLTLTWWCGATLITIGLILIHHGSPQADETDIKKLK